MQNNMGIGMEMIAEISEYKIKLCPECLSKGNESILKQCIIFDDYYFLKCNNVNCCFVQECYGAPCLTEEELKEYGLPGELLLHMEIYEKDVAKIIRLGMVEYWNNVFLEEKKNVQYLQELLCWMFNNQVNIDLDGKHFDKLTFISDVTVEYEKRVKEAFSKIKDYSFPKDLIFSLKNQLLKTE